MFSCSWTVGLPRTVGCCKLHCARAILQNSVRCWAELQRGWCGDVLVIRPQKGKKGMGEKVKAWPGEKPPQLLWGPNPLVKTWSARAFYFSRRAPRGAPPRTSGWQVDRALARARSAAWFWRGASWLAHASARRGWAALGNTREAARDGKYGHDMWTQIC